MGFGWYEDLNIEALRNFKGELVIVATNIGNVEAIKLYKKRWEIETMFSAFKTRGFNLEETHMQDLNKLSLLFGIISLSFVWCYHIGIQRAKVKPIKVLKHGFKEKRYFKLLSALFTNSSYKNKRGQGLNFFLIFLLNFDHRRNYHLKLEQHFHFQ